MAVGACVATLALAMAACSDSGDDAGDGDTVTSGTAAASRYTTPLKGACPDTVVHQTGWWPDISVAFAYQLLGPDAKIDTHANRVVGPLGGTGVTLEIRAGGPAVGFQPVSSLLAQDEDVLFGLVNTDDAIQLSGSQPTVGVFAPFEKSPLALLWGDPAWDFADVAEVGESGARVLASEGNAYIAVFEREGLLDASQVDTSYQGSPDRFVAADGKIVQQGFVTYEPYTLEHDVPAWGKPVEYLLLADEYPSYVNTLAVLPDRLETDKSCLSKLVPLFQQAQRDYIADPGSTNELLLEVVGELDTGGFGVSPGLFEDGNAKQRELGLIANGPDGVLGSFDTTRVEGLIDRLAPVFTDQGTELKSGLTPADLLTNEFLDDSVSLP